MMNAFAEFPFESFLTPQNPESARWQQQPRYGLPRALLASSGGLANSVCMRLLEIAADWLGVEPPIAHWEIRAAGQSTSLVQEQINEAAALLDQIAQRKVAHALRPAGYELQNPDELLVWLVVSDDAGHLPDPVEVRNVGDLLRKLTWSRMRAQITLRIMALVEPANGDALQQWRCQAAETAPMYLCSPVNLHHLRLADADYTEQAASALAALLCGNFPSHAALDNASCTALGAAVWTAPIPTIRRGLALLSALNAVAALQANLDAGANDNMGVVSSELAVARTPGLAQSDLELTAAVSPAQPAVRWRDLGIGWDDLADLRLRVQERLERRTARHEQTLAGERHAWLHERLGFWGGVLAEIDRLQEPEGENPPPLHRQQLNLKVMDGRLRQDLDTLAAAFERNDLRLQGAREQVDAAWAQVEKLCGQLPPATPKGILLAVLQLWMWPIWPYAFRTLLPQEGQKALDGMALQSKVCWHEANWHVLRQTMLTMRQDVNQRLRSLEQIGQYVLALHTHLHDELAQLSLPAPWTLDALAALWAANTCTSALAAFPHQERPIAWLTEPPDCCAKRLTGSYYAATAFVEQWTVLDCLAQPFLLCAGRGGAGAHGKPPDNGSSTEPQLPANCLTWLSGLAETALPLWPEPALTPVAGPVGWCLLPLPVADMADSGYGQDSIRHWREAVENLAPAALAGRTLAILRWAPAADERQAANEG